jgi:hypothetical protein
MPRRFLNKWLSGTNAKRIDFLFCLIYVHLSQDINLLLMMFASSALRWPLLKIRLLLLWRRFCNKCEAKLFYRCLVYTFPSTSIYFSKSTLPHVRLDGRKIVSRYSHAFLSVEEGRMGSSPLKNVCGLPVLWECLLVLVSTSTFVMASLLSFVHLCGLFYLFERN